ncbi:hypothetical protein OWM07_03265 [Deferribacter thermophilus]|uniref:hypothetical protein n=1 Tax=Deferribacter thermophilus TaxID=53573 RepID=UPI003C232E76
MHQLLTVNDEIVLYIKNKDTEKFDILCVLRYAKIKTLEVTDDYSIIKIESYKIDKTNYPESFIKNITENKEFYTVTNELDKGKKYELSTIIINADNYIDCNNTEKIITGAEIKYFFEKHIFVKECA